MILEGIPFCTFCLTEDGLHNEATWVIEVRTPDEAVNQRLLACSEHAHGTFELMDDEAVPPNYTMLRRWVPSDAILSFHELEECAEDDREPA